MAGLSVTELQTASELCLPKILEKHFQQTRGCGRLCGGRVAAAEKGCRGGCSRGGEGERAFEVPPSRTWLTSTASSTGHPKTPRTPSTTPSCCDVVVEQRGVSKAEDKGGWFKVDGSPQVRHCGYEVALPAGEG